MILGKAGARAMMATALGVGSLVVGACGIPHAAAGQIAVVGAETQYADVLGQIGGRYVSVSAIVNNPSADPHDFEASTSVAREIAQARLIVQNGDGYDAFMNQIETATSNPARVVLSVAVLDHRVGAANPHLWYLPSTMKTLAGAVTRALSSLAPSHAAYFARRDAVFVASWRRVTEALSSAKQRVKGYRIATTEPVGDYLFAAMGLVNMTPWRFQADVMNGVDPSPEDIATQEDLIVHHRVLALIYNSQVGSSVTENLRALARHIATIPIAEIMSPREHVQTWFLHEIARIQAQLLYVLTSEAP